MSSGNIKKRIKGKIQKLLDKLAKEYKISQSHFDTARGETLDEYLLRSCNEYFDTVSARHMIADKFLETYASFYADKNQQLGNACKKIMSLCNVNNLYVDFDDDANVRIGFDCSKELDELARGDAFSNFDNLGGDLKVRDLYNRTYTGVLKRYDHAAMIVTMGIILFVILFGAHPFKGREFYKNPYSCNAHDAKFFWKPTKIIFELDDNPNRFINGFHDNQWSLWTSITDEQRQFFLDALSGNTPTLEIMLEQWREHFGLS